MSKSKFNPLITASVISAVYLAGLSNVSQAVVPTIAAESLTSMAVEQYQDGQSTLPAANAEGQRRYIIQFNEEPVARYNGTGSFSAIPRRADNKIEVNSPAVSAYVSHLKQQQANFLSTVSTDLGRSVKQNFSYQYAINGVVLELTASEASQLARNPDVKSIAADREYELTTDVGPQLIGADNVWLGNAPAAGSAFGEGVVFGILDSGANFDHPSFADVGGDGYDHTNPLGAGNYLGVCDPTNTDQFLGTYTCNDKIIGGYDFVNAITPDGGLDIPGPEDENGHGTHTASTAGGNLVNGVEFNGATGITISGVAPHANVIPFDTCYNPAPGAGGGCFGSSAVASIDQILADGIVDVVNYSISGGTNPWSGAVEQAFLSATDSGVFISASAGNSGPGPATLGHLEPWTSSVGASTHNRRFSNALTVTGPDPVPLELVDALGIQGTGPEMVVDLVGTMEYSGNVDAANVEGCAAFPASSFDGLVAVISRGACSFADKVSNANAAGAIGVVVHNNVAGEPIVMGGLDTSTIPSVMVALDIGLALDAFIDANPGLATVSVDAATSTSLAGLADSMAGFSSRGPSNFEYNKPDVTGPGVSILAGFADTDPGTGTPAEYGAISGTSMSSPHNAGTAALLKELNPTWSVPEIKSALMLTAVTAGVTKEDGLTPADPFDRGAGRIQVDVASSTGLVMDETAFRFLLADPANGGDPKTLNVASYKNDNCVGTCTFQRKFTSVAAGPAEYSANLSGMTGTVNPANFVVNPGQTVTIDVEVDGAALPAGDVSFGELQITEVPARFDFPLGAPITIADNTYDGTTASMDCAPITVSGISSSVFSAELELAMNHTWIGDLTVKLINPNGDELAVMNDINDASDLLSTSPISLFDGAVISAADMGSSIVGSGVVCQDDLECEFAPAPNGEPEPPSTFADLGTGPANGDWILCAGDNAGGDTGDIQAATLTVFEVGSTGPDLHMPLVVIGFPEAPDITVAPASLSATLDADTTTDVNLNISNSPVAGADLNWTFGAGATTINYLNQGDELIGTGFQAGTYTPDGFGAFTADDFTYPAEISIETMQFDGFVVGNAPLNTVATTVNVHIYADAAGVPDGHPEDGLGSAIATLSIPIADPSLDLTDNGIGIDVVAANGGPIVLPAGTYWVTVFPDQTVAADAAGRWIWFAGGQETAGSTSQLISPTIFGVTDWAALPGLLANALFEQMNAGISSAGTCGAPWITTSTAGSVVVPGADIDVTVTLDATGVAPGVYTALLCVDSDDPDEPRIQVPVTMNVEGLPDLIFADGFE